MEATAEYHSSDLVTDADGWIRRRQWTTAAAGLFAAVNAIF